MRRTVLPFVLLGLVASLACAADFVAPLSAVSMTSTEIQLDAVILEGYRLAVACVGPGNQIIQPLASLHLFIVPGDSFDHLGNSFSGDEVGTNIRGFFDPPNRSIYVVSLFRELPTVWGHEFLHAFGLKHSDAEFTRCNLLRA
jgi:hypothetical protein